MKKLPDNNDLQRYWNSSFAKIEKDKLPSRFAIEAETGFPRKANICDLGGSSGVDSLYFISKGHTVTLIDIVDAALDRAKLQAIATNNSEKLQAIQYDYSDGKIPVENNSYDVIYASLSVQYFNREITAKIFREMQLKLKRGGKAYLRLKSPEDQEEMEYFQKNAEEIEPNVFLHQGIIKSRFTKKQLEEILAQAGIKNFQVKEITEDFSGRNIKTKSGNEKFLLNEIIFQKE